MTTVAPSTGKSISVAWTSGVSLRVVEVVAVEADVHQAQWHVLVQEIAEERVQAPGEHRAAPVDPDDREVGRTLVALDDLMGDPHQGAPHVVAVQDDLAVVVHVVPSFLASRDRVKGAQRAAAARPPGP